MYFYNLFLRFNKKKGIWFHQIRVRTIVCARVQIYLDEAYYWYRGLLCMTAGHF